MKKSIWSLIVFSLFFIAEISHAQVVVTVRPTAPVHIRKVNNTELDILGLQGTGHIIKDREGMFGKRGIGCEIDLDRYM